jgi:hypothetical protein
MKEIIFALLGSIVSIIVKWLFNLITTKRQHKMEMQRLAVQNKLEVSKTAIGWLMEAKSELFIVIWALEHFSELTPNMLGGVLERAEKLTKLEADARNNFNAIELYYSFDKITEKYQLEAVIPQMLSLQNTLVILNKDSSDNSNKDEFQKVVSESILVLKQLHSAIVEMMEIISQDNLNYLR